MTEYRIVGTKNIHHNIDNKDTQNVNIGVRTFDSEGIDFTKIYNSLEDAEEDLRYAKRLIHDWQERHNAKCINDEYGAIIKWTDLHIESREITEWEDVQKIDK